MFRLSERSKDLRMGSITSVGTCFMICAFLAFSIPYFLVSGFCSLPVQSVLSKGDKPEE